MEALTPDHSFQQKRGMWRAGGRQCVASPFCLIREWRPGLACDIQLCSTSYSVYWE